MDKRIITGKYLFFGSVLCFLATSASVLLLPLAVAGTGDDAPGPLSIAAGMLFWLGMAAGILLFWLSWRCVHTDQAYQAAVKRHRPGYVSFFSSKAARAADLIFIGALILSFVFNGLSVVPELLALLAMFIALFTFCLHFLLNGRVYRYIFLEKSFLDFSKNT